MSTGDSKEPGDRGESPSPERIYGITPEVWQRAQERLAKQLAPALTAIARSVSASIAPAVEALSRIEVPKIEFPPALLESLNKLAAAWPPNWTGVAGHENVSAVVRDDGLPLVWVPRAEIVQGIVQASGRHDRLAFLLAHQGECLDDAEQVLLATMDPKLTGQVTLIIDALEALRAGHSKAAQALACVVIESATREAIAPRSRKVADLVAGEFDDSTLIEFRLWAALAPLETFYRTWFSEAENGPPPEALNRHVTVHHGKPQHFTPANALVAVLLAASVLRGLQELEEERARRGDPLWPW